MILAVVQNKGGVLKTSTITAIAPLYAKKGKKVLIVDTDNQGNAALAFGLNPDEFEYSIHDVMIGGEDIQNAIYPVSKNLDILPANTSMSLFEVDLMNSPALRSRPFHLLKDSLEKIKDQYDVILIDTPPSIGLVYGNVVTAATDILIPFHPETFAMRSLVITLDSLGEFKSMHNPRMNILGVVATNYDLRTNLHTDVLEQSKEYLKEKNIYFFKNGIPRSISFPSSIAYFGAPVTMVDKAKAARHYRKLYNEIEKVRDE